MLGFLENEHELVDAVDFVLDALDERPEGVGDVVDEGVGDPVRGDGDVVFELFNATADVLGVRSGAEVELREGARIKFVEYLKLDCRGREECEERSNVRRVCLRGRR